VRGLVVVEHEIDSVGGRRDEDDLENSVVGRVGEGPEDIWEDGGELLFDSGSGGCGRR
jgi:hypothetical protein